MLTEGRRGIRGKAVFRRHGATGIQNVVLFYNQNFYALERRTLSFDFGDKFWIWIGININLI